MALIKGETVNGTLVSLSVKPIAPSTDGPRDAYMIVLAKNNHEVFRREYNVHGWDAGHFYMYRIARAFQHAPNLIDLRTDFSLSNPLIAEPRDNQLICIREDVRWMEIVLWGKTYKYKNTGFIFVQVYLKVENLDEPNAEGVMRFVRIICSPEECVRFGHELEQECLRAKAQRAEIGMLACEEQGYD